jgi:hypothetical protein
VYLIRPISGTRFLALASKWAWVVLVATALLLTSGCLRVVRQEAPYYVKGPHQIEPPDGFFPAGKKVMVFGEKDSYKRILTFDLVAAYIWKQDLLTLSEWRYEQQQARGIEDNKAGADSEW